jgi:hypothetical protein
VSSINLPKTPYSTVEDVGKRANTNKGDGGKSYKMRKKIQCKGILTEISQQERIVKWGKIELIVLAQKLGFFLGASTNSHFCEALFFSFDDHKSVPSRRFFSPEA